MWMDQMIQMEGDQLRGGSLERRRVLNSYAVVEFTRSLASLEFLMPFSKSTCECTASAVAVNRLTPVTVGLGVVPKANSTTRIEALVAVVASRS